jgi:hypothetical protein
VHVLRVFQTSVVNGRLQSISQVPVDAHGLREFATECNLFGPVDSVCAVSNWTPVPFCDGFVAQHCWVVHVLHVYYSIGGFL